MSDVPTITGTEVLRALAKAGFHTTRTRGSHHVIRHADGRWTTVPVHGGRDIEPHLLRKILRDMSISVGDFVALL